MTTNYKETDLVEAIKVGDHRAYSVFMDTYKNLVFSLALKMLKDKEEAEEVAQDSFVKAFNGIDNFKGDSKLSTWLYKIVYYACLDRLKKKKTSYGTVSLEERYDISDKEALDASKLMENEDLKREVKRCLDKIDEEDAFLLTLFYFEEQSLEEIAKLLDITANNAKVKLYRARKKMSSIFKENLETELLESYERKRE